MGKINNVINRYLSNNRRFADLAEEERSIGREEGLKEGHQAGLVEKTHVIVRNMLLCGMTGEDIMAIAECNQDLVDKVRAEL